MDNNNNKSKLGKTLKKPVTPNWSHQIKWTWSWSFSFVHSFDLRHCSHFCCVFFFLAPFLFWPLKKFSGRRLLASKPRKSKAFSALFVLSRWIVENLVCGRNARLIQFYFPRKIINIIVNRERKCKFVFFRPDKTIEIWEKNIFTYYWPFWFDPT